jgi:hypothetical protein
VVSIRVHLAEGSSGCGPLQSFLRIRASKRIQAVQSRRRKLAPAEARYDRKEIPVLRHPDRSSTGHVGGWISRVRLFAQPEDRLPQAHELRGGRVLESVSPFVEEKQGQADDTAREIWGRVPALLVGERRAHLDEIPYMRWSLGTNLAVSVWIT